MMFLHDDPPPPAVLDQLAHWQTDVDAISDYPTRVAQADRWFNSRNREGNPTFDAVRGALKSMCSGSQHCCYCEDSRAHQVEHVRPRWFYPEQVFAWPNMLWVCGDCNNRKLAKLAVMIDGRVVAVRRKNGEILLPPPAGAMAMLDPRAEDPMAFMILDLADTFQFIALPDLDALSAKRVDHTINEVLGLNDDPFPERRFEAYFDIRAGLNEYLTWRDRGESSLRLDGLRARFARRSHQTVWREVQRQMREPMHSAALERDFASLFEAVPEALNW